MAAATESVPETTKVTEQTGIDKLNDTIDKLTNYLSSDTPAPTTTTNTIETKPTPPPAAPKPQMQEQPTFMQRMLPPQPPRMPLSFEMDGYINGMENQLKQLDMEMANKGKINIPSGIYAVGLALVFTWLYKIKMDNSDKYFVF